jgi:excisionase family DNA binding protein
MYGSMLDRFLERGTALTVAEVSQLLSVSTKWVYESAAAGRLPSFRVGLLWRFDPFALAQWMRSK